MRVTQHTNTARRPFDKSLFSFSARSEKKLWKADAPQSQWERRRGRKDRIASGTDHVTHMYEYDDNVGSVSKSEHILSSPPLYSHKTQLA